VATFPPASALFSVWAVRLITSDDETSTKIAALRHAWAAHCGPDDTMSRADGDES
jgi:hypothetical protein